MVHELFNMPPTILSKFNLSLSGGLNIKILGSASADSCDGARLAVKKATHRSFRALRNDASADASVLMLPRRKDY
jgi:hypothetical protein